MDFDQAIAITGPHAAVLARRRLQRALDVAEEAHREAVAGRLAVSRYSAELDADIGELQALAEALTAAAREAAQRLTALARNNLSIPEGADAVCARELGERLEEALDGLLTPAAARLVGAAVAVQFA
jgi:hypothetical protein